jgi:V8-like Glu-specific endopeptidase
MVEGARFNRESGVSLDLAHFTPLCGGIHSNRNLRRGPMKPTTIVCLLTLLVSGATQGILSAQTKPQVGYSGVSPQQASAAIAYWTAERRAAAQTRDMLVDPSSVKTEGAPTFGAPQVNSPGGAPTSSLLAAADSTGQVSAQAGYWSTEKMAGAIPRQMTEDAPISTGATPEPTGYNYSYPFTRYNVPTQLYWSPRVYPYTTVGKLFFTLSGVNYVCSASVSRPHLLITARHCIFNYVDPSGGTFATNVVFYPGYNGGSNSALGGAWAARVLYTWVSNAPNYRYDIGFIQLYNQKRTACSGTSANQSIDMLTGYLGWSYGGDYSQVAWSEFGYPAASPFTGNVMVVSHSSTGALNTFGQTDTIEVGNDETGGTSGGPWIKGLGTSNYVNGVNSFRWTSPDHSQAINSPAFQQYNFYNLLTGAQAIACP